MKNVKMALIYDFDKTLSPKDMQEFHLIESLGFKNPGDFWAECSKNSEKNNMDGILSYMQEVILNDPTMTKEKLIHEGSYVELYPGVDTWFKRINEYGKKHHIDIEHYIISSGLKEIIEGTSIASEFKKIYACSYAYDDEGRILWPSRVVNYTTKTQYLYRIRKYVLDELNDEDLNKSTPDELKVIPMRRMVYFGDGLTDVPSMKTVGGEGGHTIAVFGDLEKKKDLAEQLYKDKRAHFALKADYSEGSDIENVVKAIIDALEAELRLEDFK